MSSHKSDSELSSIVSDTDTESTNSELDAAVEDIQNDPLFLMLGQFLETESGKNVATCIDDLTQEIRAHTDVMAKLLSKISLKE